MAHIAVGAVRHSGRFGRAREHARPAQKGCAEITSVHAASEGLELG